MTNCHPKPVPEVVKHFGQTINFIINMRNRLAKNGWVDVSDLEHHIGGMYAEVCAISGERCRFVVDSLVTLHTELHIFSEELSRACTDSIKRHRQAFNSNQTSETKFSQRDCAWQQTSPIE